jgi:pimeloyl-ACP methyl ester carboxylesterase
VQPRTEFARNGEVAIAYQVIGDGPRDAVFIPGFAGHLDLMWSEPAYGKFMERLADFSRLVLYDRRGTGLSDRFSRPTTLDESVADLRAVIEASGVRTPALIGFSEGGAVATTYAATYPEDVSALVLCETFVRARPGPGYLEDRVEEMAALTDRIFDLADHWGEGRLLEFFGPSMVGGSVHRRLLGIFERAAASPITVRRAFEQAIELDATAVLEHVHVPTLVLHRRDDVIPIEAGRYVAEHIPGARFVELEGGDHMPWAGDFNRIAQEVERFLGGATHERDTDRSLATVVFVALAGAAADELRGDDAALGRLAATLEEGWRRALTDHGGTEVRSTGDAFVGSFPGSVSGIRFAVASHDVASGAGAAVRAGVHTGEVRRISGETGGLTLHIAARVMALAAPGDVLVSGPTRDLAIGSGLQFASRGRHELRGVPGTWELFAPVGDVDELPSRVDPLDGFSQSERRFVRMGGRTNAATRVLSRIVRALP